MKQYIRISLFFAVILVNITCIKDKNLAYLYKGFQLPDLIEYGPVYGDQILPKKDDSSSSSILFPVKFPFFNKEINNFYINVNGIISFNKKLSTFDEMNYSPETSYIAVYGCDIDTRFNGDIYHRELIDQNNLDYLSDFVKRSARLTYKFNALWGYMVTWHMVEPHRRYNELNNNTFQAAIFTDGESSFCLLNYFDLTWPNLVHRTNVKIGLNIDIFQNILIENNLESEFSETMNRDILNKLVQRSNINFEKGKWLFRLDKRDLRLEEPFMRIYTDNDKYSMMDYQKQSEIAEFSSLSYVPFGGLYNDNALHKADDGYVEVKFRNKISFPLYSNKENNFEKLFVNTNGLISFDEHLSYSGSISSKSIETKRLIAPLWSDIDSRYEGDILYREIEDMSNLNELINLAIERSDIEKSFKPTWAFIVNWISVEPYRNKNPLQKNSFQAILFTNGNTSYVYFQYFFLSWPNNVFHKNFKVGFSLGPNQSYLLQNFMNNQFSLSYSSKMTAQIFNNLLYKSNIGKEGGWLFRLDTENGKTMDFMKPKE